MTGPGQTIGVSVSIDPLIAELGLSRSQVSAAYLVGTLAGAMLLLPVGGWIDRAGARHAMKWIGVAFGIGLALMAGVQGFLTLAIGFTLIRWLGQGSLSLVSSVAIAHWFERRRGLVFGVTAPAISALMSLTPLILGLAVATYGLRIAWLLAAVAVWLVVVPIGHFGIVDRPSDVGQQPDGDDLPASVALARRAAADTSSTRGQAITQPRFVLMSCVLATTAMVATGLNFHQISILGGAGLSATEAAAMFVPQVFGTIAAGLAVGALADRLPARVLLTASMVLLICALAMVGSLEAGWQVLVYVVLVGAASGSQFPLVPTLLPRWFGLRNIGGIQGISMLIMVGASAVGPVTLALLAEGSGGYPTAAWWLTSIPLVTGLGALWITEPAIK
ncbi:MAG: MFS transporter [bacterium]|nr:MFS transporter [bacterium]MDE0438164.1 MFS transporter [bacterium]